MSYSPESNSTDPRVGAAASFSLLLGIASLIGFYALIMGPVAIGAGIWALCKGAKGFVPVGGIIAGVLGFGLQIMPLILALLSNPG